MAVKTYISDFYTDNHCCNQSGDVKGCCRGAAYVNKTIMYRSLKKTQQGFRILFSLLYFLSSVCKISSTSMMCDVSNGCPYQWWFFLFRFIGKVRTVQFFI